MTGERLGGTGDELPENRPDVVDRTVEGFTPNQVPYDTDARRRAIAGHLLRAGLVKEADDLRTILGDMSAAPQTHIAPDQEAAPNPTVLYIHRSAQA